MQGGRPLSATISAFLRQARAGLNRLGSIGTAKYPPETRSRLKIANFAVYLIALTSINYAILYGSLSLETYGHLVIVNLVLATLAIWVPLSHKFGDHAAVLLIGVSEYAAMLYFISQIGRDAGIQINYIIGAAAPFLLCDRSRPRLIVTLVASALVLNIATWFAFPTERAALAAPPALLREIYVNSAITTVGIIAFVVYYAFNQVSRAKAETDMLLRNILPESIAERLKLRPGETIADSYPEATVLFADMVSFTPTARLLGAQNVVALLNRMFTRFDRIADDLGVEKIKTLGDAYLAVAGVPEWQSDHAARLAEMALRMHEAASEMSAAEGFEITLRIGIETGPLMAGVIGRRKFLYDIWGDTVNMASRLQSHGEKGRTQTSGAVKELINDRFLFELRGSIEVRGIGPVQVWFLSARREDVTAA